MLKRICIIFLTLVFVACLAFSVVAAVFFITPSRRAQAGISLPAQVEDPEKSTSEDTGETESETYDNIYIADVHQSLTLRSEPNSNSAPLIEEGLAAMTKMQVIRYVENTNFAYVRVINGPYEGYEGYVNCDFITKLGEPTIRVGTEG